MIYTIEGIVERATPIFAVINCGGLGYGIHIPVTTAEKIPQEGEAVRLHTHVVYREDSQTLYGFASEEERDFFKLVIEKVSGVGPKVAISMMSKLDFSSLIAAIRNENATLLAKTPGIGKKTAERVVIELKDKLGAYSGQTASLDGIATTAAQDKTLPNASSAEEDAILALLALGYKQADATKAIEKASKILGPEATTEALIRQAIA